MYLVKKNITNLIKKYTKLKLEKTLLIIILSIVFLNTSLSAEEKFVGFIESLEGKANKTEKEKIINLNEFDQIFVNQKIAVDLNSSVTISFIDNSVLTLAGDSEFIIDKFDNISQDPSFILSIVKGKFTFESGTIAKNDKGIMKIKISEMEVNLKGTLVTGSNSKENKQISLVEDSMGKVGTLDITVDGSTTTLTEPSAGINLSENNEIQNTTLSDEETEQIKTKVKEMAVNSATKSEEKIDRAISKQLALGTIPDANGDGIADAGDIEAYKAELMNFKETKLEYFVSESGDDLSLMSEIIVNSDSEQSLSLMQGVMDNNTGSATLLMNEIMGGKDEKADFDIFSHIAGADAGNFEALRETIVAGMIEDQSTFATDTMAQMMKVSDDATGSYLVYEITHIEPTETTGYEGASLAMNVLASFTEIASEKMTELYQQDPTMIDMLTTSAFENATEEDIGMMSTMMQNSTGGNTAMLMQSMVEYNPEMVATVYDDLTSQDFDIFNHIETGRILAREERILAREERKDERREERILARENQADATMFMDPTFEDPAYEDPAYGDSYDPAYGDPAMQFFDNLKGEIFTEIVNNSDGTAADITSELMMNTSGDNAMFMMEAVMYDNPELVGQVMNSFAQEEFDIFEHFEEIAYVETEPFDTVEIDDSPDQERVKLTKEERELAKAEKKAARILAKAEKKAEKKAARILAKAEKKAEKLLAKQTGFMAEEDPFMTEDPYMTDNIYGMQNFKAQIFTEMITYADEYTMDTMAQIVSTSDAETSALVFESVIQQPSMTDTTASMYGPETGGMALEFLDSLSQMDSEAIGNMYEENSNLMGDVFESALSSATSTDAGAISGIISSSSNEAMSSMMFQNVSDSADQSFMGDVFVNVAADAPELLMAMAETNQALYENLAQDVDPAMTVDYLMTDIYNTEYDNNTATATATDTTTDAVSTKTKRPTMMKPVTSNPYQIDTWMSGIYVYASSKPYTNGVTIDATGLPPGLYFSSWGTGGEISGTPTTKGTYQVFVTATDMMDPSKFRTRNFSIKVRKNVAGDGAGTGPTWMTTPYAPATLTVDTEISEIYLYATGVAPITYTYQNLPMGLYITSYGSSYVISGTPTMVNASPTNVTITATDMNGSTSTSIDFPPVTNSGGGTGPTWYTTYPPATLTNGTAISEIYLSAMGSGTISYIGDANLTSLGLIVSASGMVSGTPTAEIDTETTVVFTATDDNGSTTESVNFPIVGASGGSSNVAWNATVTGMPATLVKNTPMTSFSLSDSVSDEPGTAIYSVDSGTLPLGLQLYLGTVSGTPSDTAGINSVTFKVVESGNISNSDTITVSFPAVTGSSNVAWNATVTGMPATLVKNTPMTSFSLSDSVSDEPGTAIYSVDSGTLPLGLQLYLGTVSGTPSDTAGINSVTFKVVESGNISNSDTITVSFPAVTGSSNVAWNATVTGMPATLVKNTPMTSFSLSDSVSDEPGTAIYSVDSGTLPLGLQLYLGTVSGTPSDTAGINSVTFKVVESGNISNSDTITVSFPAVTGSSNVAWNATVTGMPATLQVDTPISTVQLSNSVNDVPASATWTVATGGILPTGIYLSPTTGDLTGTPTTDYGFERIYTFKVQETGVPANNATSTSITFPIVSAAAETITFDTDLALGTKTGGTEIGPINIEATASLGSTITYSFTASDGFINITSNQISGIAPRLLAAESFTVTGTATVVGPITNTKTFTIIIAASTPCLSPVANICS